MQRYPSASRRALRTAPKKPEPPVTSTASIAPTPYRPREFVYAEARNGIQSEKGGAREACEDQTIGAAEETIAEETSQRILTAANDAGLVTRSPSSARRDARKTSPAIAVAQPNGHAAVPS